MLDGRRPEPEVMDLAAEAEAYAAADFADVNRAFVESLLQLVPAAPAGPVLDLGCGPADIPARLAAARPAWRLLATDASPAMLAHARQRLGNTPGGRVALLLADAKRLPLADDAGAGIISNSILHHLTDTEAFWREVGRVAAPGAFVLVRDLRRPASEAEARRLVETYAGAESPLLQEEFYRSLLSSYTPAEVTAQLATAGLAGLEVRPVTDRHLDAVGHLP
jgi:ubiquinone/menaquinone biosynthesis C-methylase UbiE